MLAHGDEIGAHAAGATTTPTRRTTRSPGWTGISTSGSSELLGVHAQAASRIRQAHPVLRRRHFFRGAPIEGSEQKDVTWLRPDGKEMSDADWRDPDAHVLGMLIDGDGDRRGGRPRPRGARRHAAAAAERRRDDRCRSRCRRWASGKIWVVMVDTAQRRAAGGAARARSTVRAAHADAAALRHGPPHRDERRRAARAAHADGAAHAMSDRERAAERRRARRPARAEASSRLTRRARRAARGAARRSASGARRARGHRRRRAGRRRARVPARRRRTASWCATAWRPRMRAEGDGFFAAFLARRDAAVPLLACASSPRDGTTWERGDPYRFLPTLGEMDLYLFGEGTHRRLWEMLGAHLRDDGRRRGRGVRGVGAERRARERRRRLVPAGTAAQFPMRRARRERRVGAVRPRRRARTRCTSSRSSRARARCA